MDKPALVRNAGDPKQVKRAKETEKQRQTRETGELEDVLTTYAGRAVLWRILGQCRLNQLSFDMDQYRTAFNEGHRNVGNWLLTTITDVSLPAYHQMQAEAATRAAMIQEPKPTSDDPNTVILEDEFDGNERD